MASYQIIKVKLEKASKQNNNYNTYINNNNITVGNCKEEYCVFWTI